MWRWFKSKVASNTTLDKFRIKVITLKDGTQKYYPQYKEDTLSSEWVCLIDLTTGIITHDVSEYELINSKHICLDNETAAKELINTFKYQLSVERAKEFKSEEIIKID